VDAVELLGGDAPFIADTSAWWRFSSLPAELAELVKQAMGDDRLWITPIVRMEILYSARSASEYTAVETELDGFRILRNDRAVADAAMSAVGELAEHSNGRSLLAFKYGTVGCTPVSTFTGDPYTSAANIIKVGTITSSGSGSFSATNAKSTYLNSKKGKKYITISGIAGKFKTANSATGTITFSQKVAGPGGANNSCGPYTIHFTATTK
jgi:predicted nucleic acid-binding protein